jgi:hypothetical protein
MELNWFESREMYLENQGMTFFLTDTLAHNHSEGEHHQRSFGRRHNSLSRN